MQNVYAYTAPSGSYPEYISVNQKADGSYSVSVRSPKTGDKEGVTATLDLPPGEVIKLAVAILGETAVKHMAERFLNWRLPENFNPDGGISFQRDYNQDTPWPAKHEPVGTNLFDYTQAADMVRHMLGGLEGVVDQKEPTA